MNKNFLVQTIIITVIYLLALFVVQNLKKLQWIQSCEDVPFWGPKWSICPKQIFFWKIINIILIYLLALFIVQNLKKLLQWIQSYEDAHFLGPKLPISANENFSRKAITEPCFMPIYMPKIKVRYWSISEILTIKEYWNLIGRETFLSITSEPDFPKHAVFTEC